MNKALIFIFLVTLAGYGVGCYILGYNEGQSDSYLKQTDDFKYEPFKKGE